MRFMLCFLASVALSLFYAGLYVAAWVTQDWSGRLILGALVLLGWGISVAAIAWLCLSESRRASSD